MQPRLDGDELCPLVLRPMIAVVQEHINRQRKLFQAFHRISDHLATKTLVRLSQQMAAVRQNVGCVYNTWKTFFCVPFDGRRHHNSTESAINTSLHHHAWLGGA